MVVLALNLFESLFSCNSILRETLEIKMKSTWWMRKLAQDMLAIDAVDLTVSACILISI